MANLNKQEQGPWCSIDFAPGTLTSLCDKLGIKDVQIEERSKLDEDSPFEDIKPLYGVIVFFTSRRERIDNQTGDDSGSENIFFANQIISEACATQAILSVVLNCETNIDIGEQLRQSKYFMKDFNPWLKGTTIVNDTRLREAQKFLTRPHRKVLGIDPPEKISSMIEGEEVIYVREDTSRYITYIYSNGYLWELDGLKKAPVRLNLCSIDNWPDFVRDEIQAKLQNNGYGKDTHFMVVTQDRKKSLHRQMKQQAYLMTEIERRLDEVDPNWKVKINAEKWMEEQFFASEQLARAISSISSEASRVSGASLEEKIRNDPTVQRDIVAIREEKTFKILEGWWLEALERKQILLMAWVADEENKVRFGAESKQLAHNYMPFLSEYIKRLELSKQLIGLLPPAPEEEEEQSSVEGGIDEGITET